MKVLHIGSELSWRGGEQQQFYLINNLAGKVDNLVACRQGSEMEKKCQQLGIKYFSLGFRGMQLMTAKEIKKICQTEKVDLIHCHAARAHAAAFLSAYVFRNSTPIIVSKRTDFPIKNSYFGRLKYEHATIKKILCVSDKISSIVKSGIKRPEIVSTVYSGVDAHKFDVEPDAGFRERYGLSKEHILVGNTSALAAHKDYFTFLNVAQKVCEHHPNIRFLIIGDGPMENEIKNYCEQLGLNEKVIFTGFINNVPNVLPQLDLFFMPSKEEGLGTSLLDAMLCKVPIVSTKAGGIPEIVIHGETGLCDEVGNVVALSQMIIDLLEDKELANRLVNKAYDMVIKDFDHKITAERSFGFYQEVLGSEEK